MIFSGEAEKNLSETNGEELAQIKGQSTQGARISDNSRKKRKKGTGKKRRKGVNERLRNSTSFELFEIFSTTYVSLLRKIRKLPRYTRNRQAEVLIHPHIYGIFIF